MYGIHKELSEVPDSQMVHYHRKWATFYERMAMRIAGIDPAPAIQSLDMTGDKLLIEAHHILGCPKPAEFVKQMGEIGINVPLVSAIRLIQEGGLCRNI